MGRQIVCIAPRGRLANLDQSLRDTAFEVRVHKPECDAKFSRNAALRRCALPHGIKQSKDNSVIFETLVGQGELPETDYNDAPLSRSPHERQAILSRLRRGEPRKNTY